MNKSDNTADVTAHYDAVAPDYHLQYDRNLLLDTSRYYPANYFRLQMLLNTFANKNLRRVIEVGVGEGTPLKTLASAGIDVWGFDISPEMVQISKEKMKSGGLNAEQIFWGDIQDSTTYAHCLKNGQFDGLLAMGVMPHVEKDESVLDNMAALVRKGGTVFIEFRNKLFSLFTFNRYTKEFILNDLLSGVDQDIKQAVAIDLEKRLRMDQPPPRTTAAGDTAPGYDKILSKFHNPFEVLDLFSRKGFVDAKLLWYHYHPAMPYLSPNFPQLFRTEAIRLEMEPSGWRGFFMCSAFVVEATKE